jgi:regulatory protein
MLITKLEPIPRQPDRVRVYVAGPHEPIDLTRLVAEEAGLRPGSFLDDLAVQRLLQRNEFQETLDRALRFLEARPRSEREVRTRLFRDRLAPELVDRVITRLRELGLLDDAAFARFWIENRERFSPRGSRALKSELFQKGLARDVIDEQLEDAVDEDSGAREVALRQARRYARLDRQTFRQKMYAYLARRGFDFEAISAAVDTAWNTVSGDDAAVDDD